MHRHDLDHSDSETVRPPGARVDERPVATLFRAAASGRADVLGREGVLRLQRAVGNSGVRAVAGQERSPVLDEISGGGRPLDAPVRADMEARLGADFGDVQVHTGDSAHASAASVQAHAYTVGSHVVFQRDAYDPGSTAGRTMLAHELTHVVQQRSGPVDGTATGGGVRVSDPSDRFEREAAATAERAVSDPAPVAASAPAPTSVQTAAVQREAAPEEEDVQGDFVQRDAEEEGSVQGAFVQRQGEEDEEQA